MIDYIIICALFGVIIVQVVMYRRERFKLYDIIRGKEAESCSTPTGSATKRKSNMRGHRRAFIKWRNGGENSK